MTLEFCCSDIYQINSLNSFSRLSTAVTTCSNVKTTSLLYWCKLHSTPSALRASTSARSDRTTFQQVATPLGIGIKNPIPVDLYYSYSIPSLSVQQIQLIIFVYFYNIRTRKFTSVAAVPYKKFFIEFSRFSPPPWVIFTHAYYTRTPWGSMVCP